MNEHILALALGAALLANGAHAHSDVSEASALSLLPVAVSVASRVKKKGPLLSPPSWPTRSICTDPGSDSFH